MLSVFPSGLAVRGQARLQIRLAMRRRKVQSVICRQSELKFLIRLVDFLIFQMLFVLVLPISKLHQRLTVGGVVQQLLLYFL